MLKPDYYTLARTRWVPAENNLLYLSDHLPQLFHQVEWFAEGVDQFSIVLNELRTSLDEEHPWMALSLEDRLQKLVGCGKGFSEPFRLVECTPEEETAQLRTEPDAVSNEIHYFELVLTNGNCLSIKPYVGYRNGKARTAVSRPVTYVAMARLMSNLAAV
ncbi:MAG: hypothetical protein R3B84_01935 [Zavarzinella sp.]